MRVSSLYLFFLPALLSSKQARQYLYPSLPLFSTLGHVKDVAPVYNRSDPKNLAVRSGHARAAGEQAEAAGEQAEAAAAEGRVQIDVTNSEELRNGGKKRKAVLLLRGGARD